MADFRHAVRNLVRRPLFSLAVIATLAIGLGANATIFSVVDSVLLRSLPYPEPSALMAIWSTVQRDPSQPESVERRSFSVPDLVDLAAASETLDSVAGYTRTSFRLGAEGLSPERLVGTIADANYLPALGVQPLLGDGITDEVSGEEGVPGVLLSHGLWQRRFGGDPAVLGTTLSLESEPAVVVGVLPAGFRGLVDGSEIWFPLSAVDEGTRNSRGARWLDSVGRLRDDVEVSSARSELQTIFGSLEAEYADSNQGYGADLAPLAGELVGDVRSSLLVLWGAVMAVLLVAAVNVVNLFVVRLRQRSGEFALRRALGASRWRLTRGFLAETTLLGVLAGVAGMGLAVLFLRMLEPLAPVDLPEIFSVALGVRVLGFVALLALVAGLVVGLFAGVRLLAQRGEFGSGAAASATRSSTGRDPLRTGLLMAEVALATLLTIGAGLLVLSFSEMSKIDPGTAREGVGFLRVDWSEGREAAALGPARDQLLQRVASISGVESVALASDSPLGGANSATLMSVEGMAAAEDQPYSGAIRVYRHMVTPDYFGSLEIPLLRGRDFSDSDTLPWDDESRGPSAPGVAIVSQALAERAFPGQDPVGQRFYLGPPTEGEGVERRPWFEVVGMVADHRHRDLIPDPDAPADPDVFFAMRQFNQGAGTLVVRSALPIEPLVAQVSTELRRSDPSLLTFAPDSISARIASETARPRFSGTLMSAFAVLALLLAAVGIYGVVANSVVERRREIGVRMALGADRARVLGEVATPILTVVAAGLVIGLIGALAGGRLVEAQMFDVSTRDLRVFAGSSVLLGLVGLGAAILPARKASKLEPVAALRED